MTQPLFGGRFPNLPLKPSNSKFQNLVKLGKIDKAKQYPVAGMNYSEDYSELFQIFGNENPEDYRVISDGATYRKVRAKKDDVSQSIGKIDRKPKNPNNTEYIVAKEYAWKMMRKSLTKGITGDIVDLVMKASSGIPYTWAGYRSKRAAIESELFTFLNSIEYQALYATYDKVEFLDKADLARNKVRTMFGPDVGELIWQKIFFDAQNQGIIDNCGETWIKYGMVKQYGGFDALMKKIEKFNLRAEGDLTGYDRGIDLAPVYDMRLRGLQYPSNLQYPLFRTVENIIHSIVVLPNGDVVETVTGNRSGTNNTASDNSLGHLIMKFYQLIRLRVDKGLSLPTYEECLENAEIAIYSDDFIMSINDEFFQVTKEELHEVLISTYAEFGLEMKPSAVLITYGEGHLNPDHSFLGSYATWSDFYNMYIPYPRMGKICSSVLFDPLEEIEPIDQFTRLIQLAVLAYVDEKIFKIIIKYAVFLYNRFHLADKLKADDYLESVSIDLDSRASFLYVVTGRESTYWRKEGFKKCSHGLHVQ